MYDDEPSPLDLPDYDPKKVYGNTYKEQLDDVNDHQNRPDKSRPGQSDHPNDQYGNLIPEDKDHE